MNIANFTSKAMIVVSAATKRLGVGSTLSCRPLNASLSSTTTMMVTKTRKAPLSWFFHVTDVSRGARLSRAFSSFSFAGPKKIDEILQKEKVQGLSSSEISDLWMTYHEPKVGVHGIVRPGEDGLKLLQRAKQSPFFIQPVVKDNQGFYMLVSQFMDPCHFILAYLEDYRLDPAAANPLMSFSVFTDYSVEKDLTLVRVDVTNKGLEDYEGYRVATMMLDSYCHDDEYNKLVLPFNKQPDKFDIEGFISRQQEKWRREGEPESATT